MNLVIITYRFPADYVLTIESIREGLRSHFEHQRYCLHSYNGNMITILKINSMGRREKREQNAFVLTYRRSILV